MGVNRDDKLRRAYARIRAIRNNVPNPPNVVVQFGQIEDYHQALQHLKDLGENIEEFKVPENQIERSPVSGLLYVDRALFLAKVDSVLNYFDEPDRPIGFKGP